MTTYESLSDVKKGHLRDEIRKNMDWTAATLANNFLVHFTEPWPEKEAADLWYSALATKRTRLRSGGV